MWSDPIVIPIKKGSTQQLAVSKANELIRVLVRNLGAKELSLSVVPENGPGGPTGANVGAGQIVLVGVATGEIRLQPVPEDTKIEVRYA